MDDWDLLRSVQSDQQLLFTAVMESDTEAKIIAHVALEDRPRTALVSTPLVWGRCEGTAS